MYQMHNISTPNERLFASKHGSSFNWYLAKEGVNHYAINTLLYLKPLGEKYVKMYEEFIIQLCMYTKVIRILSNSYVYVMYNCESTIYFNLGADIIKENCKFGFYFNKTDITPTVLDGGNEII